MNGNLSGRSMKRVGVKCYEIVSPADAVITIFIIIIIMQRKQYRNLTRIRKTPPTYFYLIFTCIYFERIAR